MQHLGLLFTLAVLAVNLWGLMLIAGLYWRNRWFALPLGPILAVTTIYAIECHCGLGRSLGGLALFSTLLSAGMIAFSVAAWEPGWLGVRGTALVRAWRTEFAPRGLIGCFGVCTAVFLYAMAWRFIYPNVDGSSEKIADFSYICSYYSGATLPVPDVWFYPYLSTQYYSFQHYGAALMGRLLLLPPGAAYNIGYCLLIALGGAAFAGAVFQVARRPWTRAMVVACFVVGGTGITLLDHFTDKNVTPWTTMRFIGSAQMDKPPVGTWLRAYQYQKKFQFDEGDGKSFPMELPGEIYSYVVFLGDFHAPLSGYYLLGLCAMAMMLWTPTRQGRYSGGGGGHADLDPAGQHLGAAAPGARRVRLARDPLARLAPAGAGGGDRRGRCLARGLGLPVRVHLGGGRLQYDGAPGAVGRAHAPAALHPLFSPDDRLHRARLRFGHPPRPGAGPGLAGVPPLLGILLRRRRIHRPLRPLQHDAQMVAVGHGRHADDAGACRD